MDLLQTNANKPTIHESEHVLFLSFAFALFSNQKLGAKKGFFFTQMFLNFGHEKRPDLGPSMIGVLKRSV
jgi:hypothetical protein